jgi:uncharacterized protein YbaP (TraB family)
MLIVARAVPALVAAVLVTLLTLGAFAQAQADDSPAAAPLEEVVVTGVHTGPRMWRVSKGSHVMWLLGTPSYLPKDVTWQSQDVEAVLAEAELVISDVRVDVTPGLFSMLPLYLQYRKIIRLPDGQTLQQWLPADTYTRYQTLKSRYAANERLDGYRPLYVASQLWIKAREQSGLSKRVDVQQEVIKLARRHHVSVRDAELKVDKPSNTLHSVFAELQQMPRDKEVACFSAVVNTLQTHLDVMQARATAWALGAVDQLRQLQTPERQLCWEAVTSSAGIAQLSRQASERWYQTVTQALDEHTIVLALRSIDQLLGERGVLAQLRADGFAVEGP